MPTFEVLRPGTGLHLPVATPDGPVRGTIYALHGGGMSSAYWDCPFDPALSLVRMAVANGFRVAYPDRPGHKENEARWPGGVDAAVEAELHAATINECFPDAPVFIVGQSAGSMITVRTAALGAIPNLAGIDYSGVGLRLDLSYPFDGPTIERYWGPMRLYPPEVFTDAGRLVTAPLTQIDGANALTWWKVFPTVAPEVTVPVRVTMADTEVWWGVIPETLATLSAGFTASPRVETNVEFHAAHNLSVGLAARSYHLGVLSFFDRCLRV